MLSGFLANKFMTSKQLYEHVLTELNKVNAGTLLLSDFNYLSNKGIQQYVNKRYTPYEMDQQTSDDLRVLKSTAILKPEVCDKYGASPFRRGTYQVNLPDDYLHILNCTCIFKADKDNRCDEAGRYVEYGATRLTADMFPTISRNAYTRPQYRHPYYYIHNVNSSTSMPTNPFKYDENDNLIEGTDPYMSDVDLSRFTITPDIANIPAEGGVLSFAVNSMNKDGQAVGFSLSSTLPEGWEIMNKTEVSFKLKVSANTDAAKTVYIKFWQYNSDKTTMVAVQQAGFVAPVEKNFKLVVLEEQKKLINDNDYDNAELIPAARDSVQVIVDTTKKRSFGIKVPSGYTLFEVVDILGQSVKSLFVEGVNGNAGHIKDIYYKTSIPYMNNHYIFTFKKS